MTAPAITFDVIAGYVAQVLQVPKDRLAPEDLISDLSSDSLSLVELAIELQEDLDVVITQEEFARLSTLGDLETLLRDRQPGGAVPAP
jgi:acyl carrier protein